MFSRFMPARLAAFALGATLLSACAVTVVNDTPYEITEFYIAPGGSDNYGKNLLLEGEVVAPGGQTIVIADGVEEGTCVIDVRYVGDRGEFDWYQYGHDACASDTFHITP